MQIPVLHRTVLTDHGLPRLGHGPVAGIGIGVDKLAAIQARDLGDKQIILRQVLAAIDADHWLGLINVILGVVIVALGVIDGGGRYILAVNRDVDFGLELGDLRLDARKRLRLPVQRGKRGLLRRELGNEYGILRVLSFKLRLQRVDLLLGVRYLRVGVGADFLELLVHVIEGIEVVVPVCRGFPAQPQKLGCDARHFLGGIGIAADGKPVQAIKLALRRIQPPEDVKVGVALVKVHTLGVGRGEHVLPRVMELLRGGQLLFQRRNPLFRGGLQLLDFLDLELDGLLLKLLQLGLLLLKLRLQGVIGRLCLLKPLFRGLGILQRLHLPVLLRILPPRLFDFRKLGRERRLLLKVRKAVCVARERRIPLGVGLPETLRILRLQCGHGLRADLLKLGQVSRGVPGKKHGFPQGVELGVHGCGLAHDFRRGGNVGPGLVEQIGLHLAPCGVDARQLFRTGAQRLQRGLVRQQGLHRGLGLRLDFGEREERGVQRTRDVIDRVPRVAAYLSKLCLTRAHRRQRGDVAVNGLFIALSLLLNLRQRIEHLFQRFDILVDVGRAVLADHLVGVGRIEPAGFHGLAQSIHLCDKSLCLLFRFRCRGLDFVNGGGDG